MQVRFPSVVSLQAGETAEFYGNFYKNRFSAVVNPRIRILPIFWDWNSLQGAGLSGRPRHMFVLVFLVPFGVTEQQLADRLYPPVQPPAWQR